jgi:hypothetical protein
MESEGDLKVVGSANRRVWNARKALRIPCLSRFQCLSANPSLALFRAAPTYPSLRGSGLKYDRDGRILEQSALARKLAADSVQQTAGALRIAGSRNHEAYTSRKTTKVAISGVYPGKHRELANKSHQSHSGPPARRMKDFRLSHVVSELDRYAWPSDIQVFFLTLRRTRLWTERNAHRRANRGPTGDIHSSVAASFRSETHCHWYLWQHCICRSGVYLLRRRREPCMRAGVPYLWAPFSDYRRLESIWLLSIFIPRLPRKYAVDIGKLANLMSCLGMHMQLPAKVASEPLNTRWLEVHHGLASFLQHMYISEA